MKRAIQVKYKEIKATSVPPTLRDYLRQLMPGVKLADIRVVRGTKPGFSHSDVWYAGLKTGDLLWEYRDAWFTAQPPLWRKSSVKSVG